MADEKYPCPLNVRISNDLSDRLTRRANQERRTVSNLVRYALEEWIDAEEGAA